MMLSDVLYTLIHTEKGTVQEEKGKYLFWVKKDATKHAIKTAVEAMYKVSITKVNTMVMPGKEKRVRQHPGYTPDWKKAVVTLKTGQKIDIK